MSDNFQGLCNPAPGKAGYDHSGSGKVAGKPAKAHIMGPSANKPPVISGDNMNMSNMGGMEHVQTTPGTGPKSGGPAPLQTNRTGPGVAKPGKGNP